MASSIETSIQPIAQIGHGALYNADCLDVLPTIESESVDLVFADPPFNLDKNYGAHFRDKISEADYLDWCYQWLDECIRILSPGGALFVYNLPKWNVLLGAHIQKQLEFRHWIAVDIKLSLPIPGRLYPSHYSLLYYTKGKPRAFTRPRVPIPVCRHCGGEIKDYGGHRNKLNPEGLNLTDVWTDIPPVRHRSTKNRGANELSIKLLNRVVEIASNPGDTILDPFGGGGSTFEAAERGHRSWIGIELGDCQPIIDRLTRVASEPVPTRLFPLE
jgi:site-specific DNA-methyltransferase (adenine-specific)